MKKIYTWTLLMAFLTAIMATFLIQKFGEAQSETKGFPSVEVFSMTSGRIGFFDRGTGKLYIYNDNFDDCLFIGQLTDLGKPLVGEKSNINTKTIQYDRTNKELLKFKDPNRDDY